MHAKPEINCNEGTLQSLILYVSDRSDAPLFIMIGFLVPLIIFHDIQGNGYSNLLAACLTDALGVMIANWDMTVALPSGKTLPSILKLPYFASYSPLKVTLLVCCRYTLSSRRIRVHDITTIIDSRCRFGVLHKTYSASRSPT